ncbi:class I SAM-dependent methyltransferase [Methylobacter sp.]|uniref:class I SAM-dependent methyltransferase n=1 Tax=Methylobacter sp. TaxID=2051955 RepID=UPI003DA4A78D
MSGNKKSQYDALFSGVIGQDYEMLNLISPLATEMSRLVGAAVAEYPVRSADKLKIVELGGGTGITTLSILTAKDKAVVISIDNEPTMQNQAKNHLKKWADEERLFFYSDDALTALENMATDSVDIVASAYTLHNFQNTYRQRVIGEIFRVLKPGGQLINGDRYALDDVSIHTRVVQREVEGYFKILTEANKLDLLEGWIIHILNDESEDHIMRESLSLNQLRDVGFSQVSLSHRMEANALVTAIKPAQ